MRFRPFSVAALLILLLCVFSGCATKEKALTLPPAGNYIPGSISMGEDYEDQVFYDFENNKVVATSANAAWDLAFESSANGSHVFMNGGKGIYLYNTHETDFSKVRSVPGGMNTTTYLIDDASGNPDSTAVANWRDNNKISRQEVFVVKVTDAIYYKFVMLSVNANSYSFKYGRIEDTDATTQTVNKDEAYNFSYFSFKDGVVTPEPPKAMWDVVFTRYRYVYRELNNFPYEVNGVLLNPNKVTAAADSSSTFDALSFDNTTSLPFTTNRDVIGHDWKTYDFNTGRYVVKKNKCYILHTRNDKVYKLHFLDFYSHTGVKGSPSFETQQIH